jgi:uroporphyrinogen decarboxylase
MNSAYLKENFGNKLTFHGGIDIQQVLPFGKKEEIETEVQTRINDLGPGGGYILAPAHNVQADVKPENILFMIDAVKNFGVYPLSI